MSEYTSSSNFDADVVKSLWNERFNNLNAFTMRELAAYGLFSAVAAKVGAEDTRTQDSLDMPNIPGITFYNPITLVTAGFPTVRLSESYELVNAYVTKANGHILREPIKRKVTPSLEIIDNEDKAIGQYARTALTAIDELVRGIPSVRSDGLFVLLGLLSGQQQEQGNNPVMSRLEQDAYVGWLTQAADQVNVDASAFEL